MTFFIGRHRPTHTIQLRCVAISIPRHIHTNDRHPARTCAASSKDGRQNHFASCQLNMKSSINHNYTVKFLMKKKTLREKQTLRAGCSKAEPKIFATPQTPFPGAQDGQNVISWRWSLPSPTDPVWSRSMHAISSYRGHRPRNKQTHKHTHKQTGPITIHCAAKLSAV